MKYDVHEGGEVRLCDGPHGSCGAMGGGVQETRWRHDRLKKTSTALQDGRSGWQKDSSQTVSCAVPSTNTPHRLDTHRFYSLSPKTSEQRKEACWQRVLLMKAARTASAAGLHIINTFDLIWKRLICGFNWFFQMWHVTLRQSARPCEVLVICLVVWLYYCPMSCTNRHDKFLT